MGATEIAAELFVSATRHDAPAAPTPQTRRTQPQEAVQRARAFFAETEQVANPAGRISAELISPYPPGVPAILPGERCNGAVVTYLRAGKAAGMTIPDASDPDLETFRVVSGHSRTQPSSN